MEALADTTIANDMRDPNSADFGATRDESVNASGIVIGSGRPSRLATDEISTQHMTLGEVFSSETCDVPCSSLPKVRDGSVSLEASSLESTCPPRKECLQTAAKFNDIIRQHSSGANLVLLNLPLLRGCEPAGDYFEYLGAVCSGIDNVMFVRSSGAEVVTSYA